MRPETNRQRLTCGRRAEDLVAQVADGRGAERDAHQQQCPHCQAALAEYDRLWGPIRDLAAETVSPPPSLLEGALRRIRGVVQHANYGVITAADGSTRIAARVVVVTARETAQAVPGVRVALGRHVSSAGNTDDDDPAVTAGVAGRSTAVEITLAADYGHDLHHLADQVRAEVSAHVRALTGLEPVQVTVIIDDIFE